MSLVSQAPILWHVALSGVCISIKMYTFAMSNKPVIYKHPYKVRHVSMNVARVFIPRALVKLSVIKS